MPAMSSTTPPAHALGEVQGADAGQHGPDKNVGSCGTGITIGARTRCPENWTITDDALAGPGGALNATTAVDASLVAGHPGRVDVPWCASVDGGASSFAPRGLVVAD